MHELIEWRDGAVCASGVDHGRGLFELPKQPDDRFRIAMLSAGGTSRRDVAEAGQFRARLGIDSGRRGFDSLWRAVIETCGQISIGAAPGLQQIGRLAGS